MAAHRLFSILVLLEMVLLRTDMRTLLTSCQRFCRAWNHLITESTRLQVALFFKPSSSPVLPGQKRTQNPLLERIWLPGWRYRISPEQIRRYSKLPSPTPDQAKAYTRQEASWRRMLLYQPPTSHVGIIETQGTHGKPLYSEVVVKPGGGFLRFARLWTLLWKPHRVRGRGTPFVWSESQYLGPEDRRILAKCADAMAAYLAGCDVVVITRQLTRICGPAPWISNSPGYTPEFWVKVLNFVEVVEDRHRLEIVY